MIACPARDQLEGLLDETLADHDRTEVEGHVDSCQRCQEILEAMCPVDDVKRICRVEDGSGSWSQEVVQRLVRGICVQTAPKPSNEELGLLGPGKLSEEIGAKS